MLSTFTVSAFDKLYINDFAINPGASKQVEIMLDNTTVFTALQADIYLPEGLSVEKEDEVYQFRLTNRSNDHTIVSTTLSNGAIRIFITSQELNVFNGNGGALVTFNIIADASLFETKTIRLENVIANEVNQTEYILPNTSCTVTYTDTILSTSITLNKSEISLEVGKTETLVATVLPSNVTNSNVTWSSNNISVAAVDSYGNVTANSAGTATITATTTDGTNLSASCHVTVKPKTDSNTCPSALYFKPMEDEQNANRVVIELQLVNYSENLNGFNMEVNKPSSVQWLKDEEDEEWVGFSGYGPTILARWEGVTDDKRERDLFKKADLKCSIKDGKLVIIEILSTNDCRFFPVLEEPAGIARYSIDMSACQDGIYELWSNATPSGCTFSYTGGVEGTIAITTDNPIVLELKKTGNIVQDLSAISNISVDKNVTGIKYYNLQGIESDTPFQGINIMVITYDDGTKITKKILSK